MASKTVMTNQILFDENSRITSPKKIEANRHNAQLSTGPKSDEGKRASSRNAAKHGLLINDVVITTRAGKEDQSEFDSLLEELRNCYKPVGMAEDLLVRELAISYWKSARALKCERGDLTCAGGMTPDQSNLSELEILILQTQPKAEAYRSLLQSSRGIDFLLLKVEQAKDDVMSNSTVRPEIARWLAPSKGWYLTPSSKKQSLLELKNETDELTSRKQEIEKDEAELRKGQRDRSAIPSKETLDKIHRYETSNVRHRYKAEARLDRLQERRRQDAMANSGARCLDDKQFYETKPTGLDAEASRKGPPNVGHAEQTSNHIVAQPIESGVTGGEELL